MLSWVHKLSRSVMGCLEHCSLIKTVVSGRRGNKKHCFWCQSRSARFGPEWWTFINNTPVSCSCVTIERQPFFHVSFGYQIQHMNCACVVWRDTDHALIIRAGQHIVYILKSDTFTLIFLLRFGVQSCFVKCLECPNEILSIVSDRGCQFPNKAIWPMNLLDLPCNASYVCCPLIRLNTSVPSIPWSSYH